MLDPWIIEEIRRREEADQRDDRPTLEIPLEMPYHNPTPSTRSEPPLGEERGVVILEF